MIIISPGIKGDSNKSVTDYTAYKQYRIDDDSLSVYYYKFCFEKIETSKTQIFNYFASQKESTALSLLFTDERLLQDSTKCEVLLKLAVYYLGSTVEGKSQFIPTHEFLTVFGHALLYDNKLDKDYFSLHEEFTMNQFAHLGLYMFLDSEFLDGLEFIPPEYRTFMAKEDLDTGVLKGIGTNLLKWLKDNKNRIKWVKEENKFYLISP